MNGLTMNYKKYRDSLERTAPPVLPHQLRPEYDIRAMLKYAKSQGRTIPSLSDEEKEQFRLDESRIYA